MSSKRNSKSGRKAAVAPTASAAVAASPRVLRSRETPAASAAATALTVTIANEPAGPAPANPRPPVVLAGKKKVAAPRKRAAPSAASEPAADSNANLVGDGGVEAESSPAAPKRKTYKKKKKSAEDEPQGAELDRMSSDDDDPDALLFAEDNVFSGEETAKVASMAPVVASAGKFVAVQAVLVKPLTEEQWSLAFNLCPDFFTYFNACDVLNDVPAVRGDSAPSPAQYSAALALAAGLSAAPGPSAAAAVAPPAVAAVKSSNPRASFGQADADRDDILVVPRPAKDLLCCLYVGGPAGIPVNYPGTVTAHINNVFAVQHSLAKDGSAFNHPPAMDALFSRLQRKRYPYTLSQVKAALTSGRITDVMLFATRPHELSRDTVKTAITNLADELQRYFSSSCKLIVPLRLQIKSGVDSVYDRVFKQAQEAGVSQDQLAATAAGYVANRINYALEAWHDDSVDELEEHFLNARTFIDPVTGHAYVRQGFLEGFDPPPFTNGFSTFPVWCRPLARDRSGPAAPRDRHGGSAQSGRRNTPVDNKRGRPSSSDRPSSGRHSGLVLVEGDPLPASVTKLRGQAVADVARLDPSIMEATMNGQEVCAKYLLNGEDMRLGCDSSWCKRIHVRKEGSIAKSATPGGKKHRA